jgi:aspartyl-tRNA(Asn)/glutamyl-tRNA(Gln) amidotransferase subunit B
MKYIGVSDVKMQEGSLRCDVNISARKKGDEKFGTRTEIKNMNSLNFIAKAMEYEFNRHVDILESGGVIDQETRRYDSALNITESMRDKEDEDDYRYFRDPDLVNIIISEEEINKLKVELPQLPDKKLDIFMNEYGLPKDDADLLIKYKKIAEYFEEASKGIKNKKLVSNYILSQVYRRMPTDSDKEECSVSLPPKYLGELISLLENKKINSSMASQALEKMLDTGKPVSEFISKKDMEGIDEGLLREICLRAVDENKEAVESYLGGKEKAFGAIIGYIMKETRGKADPQKAAEIVKEIIKTS